MSFCINCHRWVVCSGRQRGHVRGHVRQRTVLQGKSHAASDTIVAAADRTLRPGNVNRNHVDRVKLLREAKRRATLVCPNEIRQVGVVCVIVCFSSASVQQVRDIRWTDWSHFRRSGASI